MSYRRTLRALVALCVASVARADEPEAEAPPPAGPRARVSVSALGGYHYESQQPWSGVDVALHSTQRRGFSGQARLQLGVGFVGAVPIGVFEGGVNGVIPSKQAVIRLGLVGRVSGMYADYPLPFQVGGTPEEEDGRRFGFSPGGQLQVEFEWQDLPGKAVDTWTFGARAGGTVVVAAMAECDQPLDDASCLVPIGAFAGGFYGRLVFEPGVMLEAFAGPSPSLSVGYRF